jgi:hypothetical protein
VAALNAIGGGEGNVYTLRTADGGATWMREPLPVPMGTVRLTRGGVLLMRVAQREQGKITLAGTVESMHP